jgi:hypothetical protein
MTKRFNELIAEIQQLHEAKNADYSNDKDALLCFQTSEQIGISAWKGCLVRMGDKYNRACQLAKKEANVKEETIIDTLKDLAVYSLLCIELYEQSLNRNKETEK